MHSRVALAQRLRYRVHCLSQHGDHRSLKRHRTGKQFIEDDAEAIDVARAPRQRRIAACLFRSHVRRGAEDRAQFGQPRGRVLQLPGQAEVEDHRLALLIDRDVGRFQIAVTKPASWTSCIADASLATSSVASRWLTMPRRASQTSSVGPSM